MALQVRNTEHRQPHDSKNTLKVTIKKTQSTALQNIETPQTMGATINNESTTKEPPP